MNARHHVRAVVVLLCLASAFALSSLARPHARVTPPSPSAVEVDPPRVDPNTATPEALDALPGIGPALARRIVTARVRGLRFRTADDLARVRGIGPRTVERLAPMLVFADAGPSEVPVEREADGHRDEVPALIPRHEGERIGALHVE